MALSDDQKALLRLLAQREEGYEDLAALLGIGVEEVRARVRSAVAELDAIEEPAPAAPPARPASPPASLEGAASPPPARERSLPPAADDAAAPPPPPRPALRRPAPRTGAKGLAAPAWRPRMPESPERRRLLLISGAALALIAAVLIVVAIVSGGGSGSNTTAGTGGNIAAGGGEAGSGGSARESQKLTQAVLEPVSGGTAEGRAVLGKLGKQIVLEVLAKGLEPSAHGESYAIWLYHDPKLVLRIGAVKVGKSGGLAVRLPIPAELLAYVAGGSFRQIYVSATPEAAYKAEVAKAKAENRLPAYVGTTVLRGDITGPAIRRSSSGE